MEKRTPKSRIILVFLSVILLCIVVYGLSSILGYFQSSTGTISKYDAGLSQLAHHTPPVAWLVDDADIKGEINPYIRKEIEQSYVDAWGILNLSMRHQADLGLKENWSDKKAEQLANSFSSDYKIIREELNHNLKLHFISYDKQVISFSDKQVVMDTKIDYKGYSTIQRDSSDYKIIMTLDDGKWRVNKFERLR